MAHIFRFIGSRDDNGSWSIDEAELKHIRVVGLKEDDSFELIDGKGKFAVVSIDQISSKSIKLTEQSGSFKFYPQRRQKLTVVTGILKNTSELLCHLSQLGVDSIYLFAQPHTKKDLNDRLEQKFLSHLRSSTKQSKRFFIPSLSCFSSLKDCLTQINKDSTTNLSRKILLDENASPSLLDIEISSNDSFIIFIGSELGFSKEELTLLNHQHTENYSIGKFILTSITAAMCSSAIMNLKIEKIQNNQ